MFKRITATLVAIVGISFCFAGQAEAVTNAALGKTYSWSRSPGQNPTTGPHYRDDWVVNGLHDVHTSGVGVFDRGDLTDGVIQTNVGPLGGGPSPVVGQWPGAPQVDVIFDLESAQEIVGIVIGTHVMAAFNNNAPSGVAVSYGADGVTFTAPVAYNLEAMFGPLADGHHDLALSVAPVTAQYVKLTFGPGSMTEPGGSDPNEKWMLDEISILAVPEPATAVMGLMGFAGLMMRRRHAA